MSSEEPSDGYTGWPLPCWPCCRTRSWQECCLPLERDSAYDETVTPKWKPINNTKHETKSSWILVKMWFSILWLYNFTRRRTTCELLQLLLQGDWGVVGTENFGCQTVHQLLKVLVQNRSLGEPKALRQEPYCKINWNGELSSKINVWPK